MDNNFGATFVGASVATRLLMDEVNGPKNALSESVNLNDINYKSKPKSTLSEPMFSKLLT
jgi:hypothetical protein